MVCSDRGLVDDSDDDLLGLCIRSSRDCTGPQVLTPVSGCMTPAEIFLTALEIGILAFGIATWSWLSIRLARGLPILRQESYKNVPWSGTDLLLAIAATLAVQLFGLSVATFAAKTYG